MSSQLTGASTPADRSIATTGTPGEYTQATTPAPIDSQPVNVEFLEQDGFDDNDRDSAVSVKSGWSDTTSLDSSVYKYREQNGRTYHSFKADEVDYFMPNDERELDRLNLQHYLFLQCQDNKLYLSPAGKTNKLRRVLDAGTGTGIWAVEFGDQHPEASVVGVDLSPSQPSYVPPNVQFYIDNLEDEWTYSQPFDFVYLRAMVGSIRNWPRLFKQAYDSLAPGGWIEIADPYLITSDDNTLPEDSPFGKWNRILIEASERNGTSMMAAANYKNWLIEQGFVDVVQVEYKWPINHWPKDPKYKSIGALVLQNMLDGLEALSLMLLTKQFNWTVAEVDAFLTDVKKDLRDTRIHAYWPVYVVYGRKPERS